MEKTSVKRLSPLQAIRQHCRECNGEDRKFYDCLGRSCSLYPWKQGKGVYEFPETVSQEHKDYLDKHGKGVPKKQLSEEAKRKFSERMKKAWETRKAKQSNNEGSNEQQA